MQKIPVFFRDEMVAPDSSFSPSASKPRLVVDAWRQAELTRNHVEMVAGFDPVSIDDLAKTHDRQHVMDVLMCEKPNGFGSIDRRLAASLLWTNGSITRAVEHVLEKRVPVACSPTSGFHHAGPDECEGFCTFNGLIVAAYNALERGLLGADKRVLIVDCDVHYGNGTDAFLGTVASGPKGDLLRRIVNQTAGAPHNHDRTGPSMVRWLRSMLSHELSKNNIGLVIYQAGADMHASDPLGGFASTDAMCLRDRIVFEHCRDAGVPVVWNLAGGYQRDRDKTIRPVVDLHVITMIQCVYAFAYPSRSVGDRNSSVNMKEAT